MENVLSHWEAALSFLSRGMGCAWGRVWVILRGKRNQKKCKKRKLKRKRKMEREMKMESKKVKSMQTEKIIGKVIHGGYIRDCTEKKTI